MAKTIGERIRELRNDRGMTQKELGERAGIAEPTIRRYELGKLNPKFETVQKIAKALGVFYFELLPEELLDANTVDDYIKKNGLKPDDLPNYGMLVNNVMSVMSDTMKQSRETALLYHFHNLNDDGKNVALHRVQELTQLPQYQRPTAPAQSALDDTADKDPDKK